MVVEGRESISVALSNERSPLQFGGVVGTRPDRFVIVGVRGEREREKGGLCTLENDTNDSAGCW